MTNRSRVLMVQREQRKKKFSFNNFFLRKYSTWESRTGVIGKGSSRHTRPYFLYQDLTNTSRHLGKLYRAIGKGSSRPTRPYFLFKDLTNRSRVITHLGKLYRAIGKGSSRPTRPYFLFQDLTNRSRVITHLVKPDGVTGKGYSRTTRPYFLFQDMTNRSRVLMVQREQRKKKFSFNNFFLRKYSTWESRTGVIGKGSSRHTRPYFLYQDLTNTSRHLGKLYQAIGKGSSRPTRPYFLFQDLTNRSRVITHLVKPDGVTGKGYSPTTRPYFLFQDLTNRSRPLGKPFQDHWKGLFAPYMLIFPLSRSDQ
ncbi:hypothetical protein V1477_017772 [Vespula maculifrons]|uniref:Ribosomal protein S4 n=1 Tax=Vespula maculifrons TaxID=7453 RepID=A0ABD2B0V6_VESMC